MNKILMKKRNKTKKLNIKMKIKKKINEKK